MARVTIELVDIEMADGSTKIQYYTYMDPQINEKNCDERGYLDPLKCTGAQAIGNKMFGFLMALLKEEGYTPPPTPPKLILLK